MPGNNGAGEKKLCKKIVIFPAIAIEKTAKTIIFLNVDNVKTTQGGYDGFEVQTRAAQTFRGSS